MLENVGLILGGLAVLALVVVGYVAWRESRRKEDATEEAADQQKAGGGGGPKPVK